MPAYLIFLGAPGSGKGTQAQRMEKQTGIKQISTGDILRAAIKNKTDLGTEAKKFIEAGNLVPDELIINLMKEALSQPEIKKTGFILDGFPRTIDQAEALSVLLNELEITVTPIEFDVPKATIIKRITDRRICSACNSIFSVSNLKEDSKKCSNCGGELITRPDDTEVKAAHRFSVYQDETQPLLNYYKDTLIKVDATKSPEHIETLLQSELEHVHIN